MVSPISRMGMVTHHPNDSHPPFKIYQKEVYYRLRIWHLGLTHKIKIGWSADGQPHLQDGHGQPPSKGRSPKIPNLPEGSVLETFDFYIFI